MKLRKAGKRVLCFRLLFLMACVSRWIDAHVLHNVRASAQNAGMRVLASPGVPFVVGPLARLGN